MSCEHRSRTTSTTTTYSNTRVWDDVAQRWVELEMKTVVTEEKCSDCGSVLSRSERSS